MLTCPLLMMADSLQPISSHLPKEQKTMGLHNRRTYVARQLATQSLHIQLTACMSPRKPSLSGQSIAMVIKYVLLYVQSARFYWTVNSISPHLLLAQRQSLLHYQYSSRHNNADTIQCTYLIHGEF